MAHRVAALCGLLAACGNQPPAPVIAPAPMPEPSASARAAVTAAPAPIATIEFGRLSSGNGQARPLLREVSLVVAGALPKEVVSRIVRQNFGRYRLCYENGSRLDATLAGHVTVSFTIDKKGEVVNARDASSTLPDAGVVSCVVRNFGYLSFPVPDNGKPVTVLWELEMGPPPAQP